MDQQRLEQRVRGLLTCLETDPDAAIGEEIRAETGILGGTGVTITLAGIATALPWEARTAGRAWAKVGA